jgi:hypothetical protein
MATINNETTIHVFTKISCRGASSTGYYNLTYSDFQKAIELRGIELDEDQLEDQLEDVFGEYDLDIEFLLSELVTGDFDTANKEIDVMEQLTKHNGFCVALEEVLYGISTKKATAKKYLKEAQEDWD